MGTQGGLMEQWAPIPQFEAYSVSNLGRIRNEKYDRFVAITRTTGGLCMVGLSRGGKQHKRSLSHLVADAFVPRPTADTKSEFNTPIHLDGDLLNNRMDNLMWRPRWYALKYAWQFREPKEGLGSPVIELRTRELYITAWEAALAFGLLHLDLVISISNRTFVWPTFQEFRFIEK